MTDAIRIAPGESLRETDVLVLGGGPAAEAGASVILADWGYPFPRDENGEVYIANPRGPDHMRFMRARVLAAKVTVLDHHPALELWSDGDAVTGASGQIRPEGRDWTIRPARPRAPCQPPAAPRLSGAGGAQTPDLRPRSIGRQPLRPVLSGRGDMDGAGSAGVSLMKLSLE